MKFSMYFARFLHWPLHDLGFQQPFKSNHHRSLTHANPLWCMNTFPRPNNKNGILITASLHNHWHPRTLPNHQPHEILHLSLELNLPPRIKGFHGKVSNNTRVWGWIENPGWQLGLIYHRWRCHFGNYVMHGGWHACGCGGFSLWDAGK